MTTAPWASTRDVPKINLAARIERHLAIEILRGKRSAGQRLPSVRALAQSFETTIPTIQRVVARLEAMGLVDVQHGRGVEVRQAALHDSLALVPLWFEAWSDNPERLAKILADFLELRRVVAAHFVRKTGEAFEDAIEGLMAGAERLVASRSLQERVEADLALTHAWAAMGGNRLAVVVVRALERVVREVPWVAEALYGDGSEHTRMVGELLTLLATSRDAASRSVAVEQMMARWDAHAVARFEVFVRERSVAHAE